MSMIYLRIELCACYTIATSCSSQSRLCPSCLL